MENTFLAQWESFAKSAFDTTKELETLNMKLFEQLSQKQVDLLSGAVELGNKWVSSFGEYRGVPELIAAQSKLASEYGSKVLSVSKETTDLLSASREDYKAWFEKGFKLWTEQSAAVTRPVSVRKAA
ncbi:MAG TPA: phasin family protein [Gammaproteobacteria bacterium]|mgnify:CR=1 FL=1|nr:phasin family protein [Gammaproteobacteria bacterium]